MAEEEDEHRLTWAKLKSGRWSGYFKGLRVGSIEPPPGPRRWSISAGNSTITGESPDLPAAIFDAGQAFRVHRGIT